MANTGPLPKHNYLQEQGLEGVVTSAQERLRTDVSFRNEVYTLLVSGASNEVLLTKFTGINFDDLANKYSTDATLKTAYKNKLLIEARNTMRIMLEESVKKIETRINEIRLLKDAAIKATSDPYEKIRDDAIDNYINAANRFVGKSDAYTAATWATSPATTGGGADFEVYGTNLINKLTAKLGTLDGPEHFAFEAYEIVDPSIPTIEIAATHKPLDSARLGDYYKWAVENATEITDPNLKIFLQEYDMGTAGAKVQDHYQALIQDAAAYVQKEGTKDKKRDYLATELAKAILVNEKKITGATTDFYTGAVPMHSGDPLAKRLIAYCNDLITKKVNADKLDADKLDAPLSEYLKKQILETASQSATEAANYGLTALDPYNPEVFTLVDQQGDPVDEFSDEYVAYIDHLMIKTALTDQEISFLNVAGQKLNTLMINPSVAPHNLGVIHASRELFHIQSSAIPHHLRIINSERLAEYIASGATGNVKLYKNMSAEEDVDPKFLKPIPISLLKLYSRSKEGDTNNAASGSYRQRLKAKLSNDIFQAYDLNNLEEMEESLENATDAYAETRAGHAQYRLLGIMNESREKVEAARNEYLKNLQQTTTSKLIAKFATDNPNVDIINNKTDREAFLLELAEAVSDSRKKVVELERAHRTSTLPEGLENLITTHPWMATAISLGTIALAGGVAAATLTAAPWVATAAAGVAGVVAGITTWKGVSSLAQRVGGSIFGFNKKVSSEDILKIPKNTTIEAANDKIAKGIAMHDNKMYSERWKESFATTERMVNTDSSKLLMHALRERAKLANPMLSRPNTHAERIKFIAEMVAVAINQENYLNSKVEENKRYLQGIRASSDVIGGFAGIASGIGAYSAVNAIGSWINGLFTPTPPVTPGPVPPTPTPGSWAFKVPDNATSVLKFGNPDPGFLEILKESLSPLNLTDQQLHSIWNQHMGSLTDSSGNLLSGRAAGPLGNAGVDLIRDGELISGPGMDNMVQAYATASGTTVPQVQALLTF